nr:hypothetical protein [Thiolinea sp.]
INAWSCWDQHWRPRSAPQGMAHVPAIHAWVDIYFCGQEPDWGTSLHGVTAASGAYLPKVPQGAGGNGSTSCSRFGWWEAAEVAASQGKRLLHEWEFNQAAFGVTEAQSLTGSDQLLITGFEPGYTSRYGLMQATGNRWTWGADHGQRDMGATAAAWGWRTNTLGRGSIYTETTTSDIRVLLGGNRSHGAHSGSRCASWSPYPWSSGWNIGLRAASDHVQPV